MKTQHVNVKTMLLFGWTNRSPSSMSGQNSKAHQPKEEPRGTFQRVAANGKVQRGSLGCRPVGRVLVWHAENWLQVLGPQTEWHKPAFLVQAEAC